MADDYFNAVRHPQRVSEIQRVSARNPSRMRKRSHRCQPDRQVPGAAKRDSSRPPTRSRTTAVTWTVARRRSELVEQATALVRRAPGVVALQVK